MVVSQYLAGDQNDTGINNGKKKFERNNGCQVFLQQTVIPGDGPVIIIVDPDIEQHIEYECKVEKGEVKTIHLFAYPVLYAHLDAEKPDWLDQEIQEYQQGKIGDEVFFQTREVKIFF
jgi:hypothetical protein